MDVGEPKEENLPFSLLVSISIIDWKHEFTFHIAIAVHHDRREAWPLGEDAGMINQPNEKLLQVKANPNVRTSSDEGGILTALPADTIHRIDNGAGDIMSLYPPNKIHSSCTMCNDPIPRYEGYRHALIGVKRVVCAKCQTTLGLPLRDAEAYASYRD